MSDRRFDIVLWGATGFTGKLVAEYLLGRYGCEGQIRWAIAGRSGEKLDALRGALGEGAQSLPVLIADSHDRASLDEMVNQARVVLTTVGPYALHGSELVAACVAAGTDYVDLCGEVPWMRQMLDAHREQAEATGARIVHCCGFDSIPSDFGVWFLQREIGKVQKQPSGRIRYRLKAAKGGPSGGTTASMFNLVEQARKDPEVKRLMKNPYVLCPPGKRKGPRQPHVSSADYDRTVEAWTGPFVMAVINTRVVHRSNALSGYAYGADFLYDEAVITGEGFGGRMKALTMAGSLGGFMLAAAFKPTRAILKKFVPEPGEGPSREERESGFFNVIMVAELADGGLMYGRVKGDRDPGYGSTSKMISEAAVCLATETPGESIPGGFWTPSTAMGEKLFDRLQSNAGLSFMVEKVEAPDEG